MPIDRISSYQQTHTEVPSGQDGHIAGKHTDRLPKDVLEALEDDDLEKALFLLRQHEIASTEYESFLPDWMIFRAFNEMYASMMSMIMGKRKSEDLSPAERVRKQEYPAEVKVPLKAKLAQFVAVLVKVKVQFQEIVKMAASAIYTPIENAAVKLYNAISTPVKKYVVEPAIAFVKASIALVNVPIEAVKEKVEFFTEKFRETVVAFKEKFDQIRERIDEYSRPVKEWLSAKVNHFLENSSWVKQTLGAQVVYVAKAADFCVQVIAYVTVPFQFANDQVKKPVKWLLKKAEKIVERFKDAQKWVHRQLKKAVKPLSKGARAIVHAVERVGKIVRSFLRGFVELLLKLARWIYKKVRAKVAQWL
jgi:predicted dinucleotide-binding enzyme